MTLSISDVLKPATADDFKTKILSIATALGLRATSWQPGGITRTIIAVVSQVFATQDAVVSTVAAGGFLKLAAAVTPDPSVKGSDGAYPKGPGWLDLCADSGFDVRRLPPTYATGPVVITNASGSSYGPFAVGTYHLANSAKRTTYSNTTALTIAPSGNTTATFAADQVGDDSTSAAVGIDTTVTSLVGVSIVPGSQTGTLTGTNAESNGSLMARCLDKLGALSARLGQYAGYLYYALTFTEPGYPALAGGPVTRALVTNDKASGAVTTTVANAAGVPSGPDVALIDAWLQAKAVPLSVTAVTQAAGAVTVNVVVDAWVPATLQDAAHVVIVTAAVNAYLNSVPIGGVKVDATPHTGVPLDAVIASVFEVGSYVSQAIVTLNGSAANVALGATQVAVPGTVTVNWHNP